MVLDADTPSIKELRISFLLILPSSKYFYVFFIYKSQQKVISGSHKSYKQVCLKVKTTKFADLRIQKYSAGGFVYT